MTAKLILPPGADRETWTTTRRSYIGGSDIAAIINVSPYDGPMTTWMEKVHDRRKPMNDAMSIGLHMEPWILARYSRANPTHGVEPSPGMYVAADDLDDTGKPWRAANPDGIATLPDGRRALIEAKTAVRYGDDTEEGWGDEGTDEIPYPYLCQVTWNCALLGLELWVVPVLFLDTRCYTEYRGRLEPALAATLVGRGRQWWNLHVVGKVEPAADYRESTKRILADRFMSTPASGRKTFAQPDPQALEWQADYCRIRAAIKDLKTRQAEAANLLRQAHVQADTAELRVGDTTISTFKPNKNGVLSLSVKEPTP